MAGAGAAVLLALAQNQTEENESINTTTCNRYHNIALAEGKDDSHK